MPATSKGLIPFPNNLHEWLFHRVSQRQLIKDVRISLSQIGYNEEVIDHVLNNLASYYARFGDFVGANGFVAALGCRWLNDVS
jgi:hypothetical protein